MNSDNTYEQITGAQALAQCFVSVGIEKIYGLSSGKLGPLLSAIDAQQQLDFLGVRHEATAAMMATGYYAGTGNIAVCLGETGPGGLNLLSGLGSAKANNLPVIAITSSNAMGLMSPDRGGFSTSDNPASFGAVLKWSGRATDAARIPELFREALREALSGVPGPVHIDIPADVLAAQAYFAPNVLNAGLANILPQFLPEPSTAAIDATISLLSSAKRPLLVGGGGVVSAEAASDFYQLAERLQVPVITTQMGLGLLPTGHPLLIGQGGVMSGTAACAALKEADVIIAIGCRFSSWMWPEGPPEWTIKDEQKLIQIDIDSVAIGRNHAVAVGIVADAGLATKKLVAAITETNDCEDWLTHLREINSQHREKLNALASDNELPIHPAGLAQRLSQIIATKGNVVFDGGHTTFWSNDFTQIPASRRRFHEPGFSHLGFGLPWAMAMQHAGIEGPHVCITGDGAFGFTMQELDTARRHKLPVIVVVHNNAAFGVIGFSQKKSGFSIGTELEDTDYAATARGLGCFGEVVEELDSLESVFQKAIDSGLPAVIDVRCRFVPHPMMRVFGPSTAAPVIGPKN